MNKQNFENYKAELQIAIENKIAEAIVKLDYSIFATLENKNNIILSLGKEISALQNRVG